MDLSVVEQEYQCKKLTRLHKRIDEHLRSVALHPSESAFGGQWYTSDLSELLQTFRCPITSNIILTKGTHFTHTQKFTHGRVRSTLQTESKIMAWCLLCVWVSCRMWQQEQAPSPLKTNQRLISMFISSGCWHHSSSRSIISAVMSTNWQQTWSTWMSLTHRWLTDRI